MAGRPDTFLSLLLRAQGSPSGLFGPPCGLAAPRKLPESSMKAVSPLLSHTGSLPPRSVSQLQRPASLAGREGIPTWQCRLLRLREVM